VNEDFSATTRIKLRWLLPFRNYLTPAILWTAIAGLASVLVVSITWLVTMQARVAKAQDDIQRQEKSMEAFQKQGDTLNEINTKLGILTTQMTDIRAEVERQRDWRDRIEAAADTPPHARRKK
jgi:hypothetical protein